MCFEQYIPRQSGPSRILVEGVSALIKVIKCGMFNPTTYERPEIAAVVARGEVDSTIQLRRNVADVAFYAALELKNASARVQMLSARPGDAPAGIRGVVQDEVAGEGGRAAEAPTSGEDDAAIVRYNREQHVLNTRRTLSEIEERDTSKSLVRFRLEQEQKQAPHVEAKIGRASCRERVCLYV